MALNEYQQKAMTTCTERSRNFSYMMLNLVGEVGELAGKIAKMVRKNETMIRVNELSWESGEPDLHDLKAEAGDILWQLSGLCSVMGWSLDDIAQQNVDKLADRQRRGKIVGDGDNR